MNECYREIFEKTYGKEPIVDLPMKMFAKEWARTELDQNGDMTKEAMLEKARKDGAKAAKLGIAELATAYKEQQRRRREEEEQSAV